MADAEKDDLAGVTIGDLFRYLATEEHGAEARKIYCREVAELVEDVSSWLAVDALFRAGDAKEPGVDALPIDPARARAFVAAAVVAQMSSELIKGSITLLQAGNEYACCGLVRQLIECEYLFRAFQLDFQLATKWLDAPPSAKNDFSPSNLRKIGGFDHAEYSNHCEAGGHPRAGGRHLLKLERLAADLLRTDKREHETNAMLWMDLALHCERSWRALVELLAQEHARFNTGAGRTISAVERADAAHATWLEADRLARNIGPIIGFVGVDPDTPLGDLIGSEA